MMAQLRAMKGLRVVRGPDWKWGDQDGGEGVTGTVFPEERSYQDKLWQPKMVSVVWDTGVKAQYRAGPLGSFDLRVVDNSAMGVKHPGIACGGADCPVKEICGIRWQCSTCSINLCSKCFMKEIPHHQDHNKFKRYDSEKITEPPVVSSWGDGGSQSRIKLMGIYPGAEVTLPDGKLPSTVETGLVLPNSHEEMGKIALRSSTSQQEMHYDRCSSEGSLDFVTKELVVGGFYHPAAFSVLEIQSAKDFFKHSNLSLFVRNPTELMEEERIASRRTVKEKLAGLMKEIASLFKEAVVTGDLVSAQTLHRQFKVDLNGRNVDGLAAIHLACQQGHEELVQWLLREVETDREIADNLGYHAIHHAVKRSAPKILEMLIEAGVKLDCTTLSGESALDIAVAYEYKICADLLIHHGCNVNLQDSDGNTPLHRSILSSSSRMIEILISSSRIDWKLRNKRGLNIFMLAFSKDGASKIVEYLLDEDPNFLLEWKSGSDGRTGNTVLHYASLYRNSNVVKLLLDRWKLMPNGSQPLINLLEEVNTLNFTAFQLACLNKSCSIIELLVDAGADVKVVDKDGNTAIMIAASGQEKEEVPNSELSPSMFKIYNDEAYKTLVKSHPILALLIYLIRKEGCWETANKTGKKAADILLEKGYSKEVVEFLNKVALNWKRLPSGPNGCMGQKGECAQQAIYRLSCDHKATFNVCASCFPLSFKQQKCRCPDEDVSSIPQVVVPQDSKLEGSEIKEVPENLMGEFKWVNDGTEKGHIEDELGNKFIWNGKTRMDGAVGYRCDKMVGSSVRQRCKAVARRFFYEVSGEERGIVLETLHDHQLPKKRKSMDEQRPIPGYSKPGPMCSKQKRV